MGTLAGRLHKEVAARFCRRLATKESARPIISFTFDDFPRSALTVAGAMLADKGVFGTYYAAMGTMGQVTSVGKIFEIEDLRELIGTKHELACHTQSHLSAYEQSARVIAQDCGENRRRAAELLSGYELRNFSFPFGDVTLRAKAALAPAYSSCRTVRHGINRDRVDLAFLKANPLYSSRSVGEINALIAENARENGWLILYTHDVGPSPSPYGCTSGYFQEVLAGALASGAEILPVRDALARFSRLAR